MTTAAHEHREVCLTLKILLKDSHPAIAEHSGYFAKEIGELLLRHTADESLRREIADRLGVPQDLPFRLVVHASNEGHVDRQQELGRKFRSNDS